MLKLVITPSENGYSVTDGNEIASTKLDGGLSKSRKDKENAAAIVSVKWTVLSKLEYEYIRAFYRTPAKTGANEFLIDLLMDDTGMTEHIAKFVPGSFKTDEVDANTYGISAQLEVKPLDEDEDYNNGLVASYNAYGTDYENFYNMLSNFVNVQLPAIPVFDGS
ncbi:hypothetical protein EKK58_10560 [Candidatus Dependentiae bacterium]|nr:MAG: hypothetical protein EKK58_10560 [Candidatus Dependentiae bacterium]